MPDYLLRYFFDAGSGACLWSVNDAARDKFDYAVALQSLDFPENLLREAYHILAWCDTALDWSSPSAPSSWSAEENVRFNQASQRLLAKLRQQLGPAFEIRDESGTMPDSSSNTAR
jgi:hypothetical protein